MLRKVGIELNDYVLDWVILGANLVEKSFECYRTTTIQGFSAALDCFKEIAGKPC